MRIVEDHHVVEPTTSGGVLEAVLRHLAPGDTDMTRLRLRQVAPEGPSIDWEAEIYVRNVSFANRRYTGPERRATPEPKGDVVLAEIIAASPGVELGAGAIIRVFIDRGDLTQPATAKVGSGATAPNGGYGRRAED